MKYWIDFLCSSIGKKLIMSFTGMALALFLVMHCAGNLILLADPDAFNEYAHMLVSNPLLPLAEVGLLGIFVLHVLTAIKLSKENAKARPAPYKVVKNSGRSWRSIFSGNMVPSGLVILVFLIFHIIDFKFGPYYETEVKGVMMRDLARLVIEELQETSHAVVYIVAMLVLGGHLIHAIRSSFQTLGWSHVKWDSPIYWLSRAYLVFVVGGFLIIPVVIYLKGVMG